jgi:DNA-binding protein YbaB
VFLFGKEMAKSQFTVEQKEDLVIVTFTGNGFLIRPDGV